MGDVSLGQKSIEDEPHEVQLLRATQSVRTRQSMLALPLSGAAVLSVIGAYYQEVPIFNIGTWGAFVLMASLLRGVVTRRISGQLDSASPQQLHQFERQLVITSSINGLAVGSGILWIGLADTGSSSAIYAVTFVSVLYASLSMINASVQFDSFARTLMLILGPSILYFIFGGTAQGLAVGIGLSTFCALQLSFGRGNANQFEESIKMRTENQRLLRRLGEEKHAVDHALIQAREANESKSHFLAAASHDLRQPLHALGLYLGSLEMLVTNEQGRVILTKVMNTATVLRDQFNSLLDLSQFDAGGVQMEQALFRIDTLLRRSLVSFEEDIKRKGLTLAVSYQPITVISDPVLLERMVQNLIENAIRYTAEGGITIEVSEVNGRCAVVVSDTGQGIRAEDQKRIFDDFVQLHNKQREKEHGVGLGLAIVRRIGMLLDLDLKLYSEHEVGTRFEFNLGIGTVSLPDDEVELHLATANIGEGVRVWAIDDDQEVGNAMRMQLESWGCEATLITGWKDVNKASSDFKVWPHLFLIDDMLSEAETGLDIAKRLVEFVGDGRIVLVTGNTLPERLDEIKDSGFPVLLKPTPTNQLKNLVVAAAQL